MLWGLAGGGRARQSPGMWKWTKLARIRSLGEWEKRVAGDSDFVIEILPGGRSMRVNRYSRRREEAEDLRKRFGGAIGKFRHGDWGKGQSVPPPVKIRERLLLTGETGSEAVGQIGREHPGREVISIPSGMAFGTGGHATTATCLRMLADIARERKWTLGGGAGRADCVADLGSGSGVLAVAARKLGSGPVWACDFDASAVAVAKRNIARNRTDGIEVAECDVLRWEPPKRFDVVMANLFSSVLLEAMPVLARALAPGGDLVVSGILREQAWEVFASAAVHGIGFQKVVTRGKWVTARGGRADTPGN